MLNDVLKAHDSKWCGVTKTHTITCKDPCQVLPLDVNNPTVHASYVIQNVYLAQHTIHFNATAYCKAHH
jgi:hypothetical protein